MVERKVLVRAAGIVWLTVGAVLIAVASWWFSRATGHVLLWAAAGLLGGALVYRFKLAALAAANMERIRALAPGDERVGLLEFQSRRSYLIIALMIVLGYTLRHLPLPRIYLAPLYLAMGLGLILAGSGYFRSA